MSVGIDIGSKTIKVVELKKDGDFWRLKGSGIVAYSGPSPDMIEDGKDAAVLVSSIQKLFKEAKISTKDVHIALPEAQVFSRTINFPLLTDQEVESAIKWEAEQYIPIRTEDAIVQHLVLERRENMTPAGVSVLLVAAQRVLVEKYINTLQMAGLNIVGVETELLALVRSLAPAGQTVMIVDFGARSTDIAIAKDAKLVFSRSIPTAGDAFTRAVAQGLGMESVQAEEYKRAYGLSESQMEGKVRGILGPVFSMVADEMKKAVHFYETEEKGERPELIILSGGSSNMPEGIVSLSQILGVEVLVGNPFLKVKLSGNEQKNLAPYAPLYSISVGLAQRGE